MLDTNPNRNELFVEDPSTGIRTLIRIPPPGNSYPIRSAVWSPNGESILLSMVRADGGTERSVLLKLNPRSGSLVEIGAPYFSNAVPLTFQDAIWSPDASEMALVHSPDPANQCAFIVNADGTNIRRLNQCEADDRPRFWSKDGRWVIVYRERDHALYALEAHGNTRLPIKQLKGVTFYDERYFPWKEISEVACDDDWRNSLEIFWHCQ